MPPLLSIFRPRTTRPRRAFTLIEAALVTVIVGTAVAALLTLLAAGTVANSDSAELTTAVNLANNLHEASLTIRYDNLPTTFQNHDFSPPVNSGNKPIPELSPNWKQHTDVYYIDPNNLNSSTSSGSTPTAATRILVTIYHNNAPVYTTQWVVSDVP